MTDESNRQDNHKYNRTVAFQLVIAMVNSGFFFRQAIHTFFQEGCIEEV